MEKKILPVICLFLWFCVSIYFGTGGYNYIKVRQDSNEAKNSNDTIKVMDDGIKFKNRAALDAFLEEEATIKLYPMIKPLPTEVFNLITIFAFGILGSFTNLIKQVALENKRVEDLNYVSLPILGMLGGFIIIGLSYLIPNALATSEIELKPMGLIFLSLFSGFFAGKFFEYVSGLFAKIFILQQQESSPNNGKPIV